MNYPHVTQATKLCHQIYEDSKFSSGIATDHPLYKELVGMGSEVVPALLHLLDSSESRNDLAIWELLSALREITGAEVVPENDRGRLLKITEHWLTWGEQQNLYTRSA